MINLVFRIGYFFMWKCRVYLVWSKIYRWVYHRQYKHVKLLHDLNAHIVEHLLKKLTWTKDGPRELWDAIGSPHWVEYCLDEITRTNIQPYGSLDCDEFAVWAACALKDEFRPIVFNVFWRNGDGFGGHHICVFRNISGYYHIGNWGKVGPFPTQLTAVEDVVKRKDGKIIGWAMFDPMKLNLLDWGFK
jgi:hypothetical protein